MFSLFRKRRKGGGLIGHLGLMSWWSNALTDDERSTILERYQPLGRDSESLTEGVILSTSQTPLGFLSGLLTWFKAPEHYELAQKIIDKSVDHTSDASVVTLHFFLQGTIEVHYRQRNDITGAIDAAIAACQRQIDIAPQVAKSMQKEYGQRLPAHKGYLQLAIILEKQNRHAEAIALCHAAQKQGWGGDWTRRLTRLQTKAGRCQNSFPS